MSWYTTPYVIAMFLGAAMSLVAAAFAWHWRSAPGGRWLVLLILAIAQWCAAGAVEAGIVGTPAKILWSQISYLGIVSSPVLLFLFALEYAGYGHWLTRRRLILLWIVPLLILIMAITNGWHGLLWSSFTPSTEGTNALIYGRGPAFWLSIAYDYALVIAASSLLARMALGHHRLYRWQSVLLLLAILLPWAGNILYMIRRGPFPGFDTGPLAFTLTGILLVVNINYFRFLDLVPVACELVLESMRAGVVVLDAKLRIVDSNPAARRLLGVEDLPAGQEAKVALAAWPQLLAACQAGEEGVIEMQPPGGTATYLEVQLSTLRARREEAIGQLITLNDISERRQLEEQQRQVQKLEAVGTLAGGVAHQFNNLMMAVIGYGELLRQDLPPDDARQEEVAGILEAARRAASLTHQLLAFSRRQMLLPKLLELNDWLAGVAPGVRAELGEGIELAMSLAPEPLTVKVDPRQLEHVLLELARNAREAMGGAGRLTLETASVRVKEAKARPQPEVPPGTYARLTVRDTGRGMDAAAQAHAFEPFFTTKGLASGTGLGLASAYGIVRQSDGYITVQSAPGQGTAFHIYLPQVAPSGP